MCRQLTRYFADQATEYASAAEAFARLATSHPTASAETRQDWQQSAADLQRLSDEYRALTATARHFRRPLSAVTH